MREKKELDNERERGRGRREREREREGGREIDRTRDKQIRVTRLSLNVYIGRHFLRTEASYLSLLERRVCIKYGHVSLCVCVCVYLHPVNEKQGPFLCSLICQSVLISCLSQPASWDAGFFFLVKNISSKESKCQPKMLFFLLNRRFSKASKIWVYLINKKASQHFGKLV